jgi:hypothetical protein
VNPFVEKDRMTATESIEWQNSPERLDPVKAVLDAKRKADIEALEPLRVTMEKALNPVDTRRNLMETNERGEE